MHNRTNDKNSFIQLQLRALLLISTLLGLLPLVAWVASSESLLMILGIATLWLSALSLYVISTIKKKISAFEFYPIDSNAAQVEDAINEQNVIDLTKEKTSLGLKFGTLVEHLQNTTMKISLNAEYLRKYSQDARVSSEQQQSSSLSIRRINRIPDLFNRSDFVGFRVIELTIGTGQWVKKLGLDSVRYGVYPENRQKSARQAC